MLEKCLLTILELNWNQRLGHKKAKLNICHHMLTSSTQLQNSSSHVVERTRTSTKCQNMKNARAKRAIKYCFSLSNMQICGVFVAAAVVVAYTLPYSKARTRDKKGGSFYHFSSSQTKANCSLQSLATKHNVIEEQTNTTLINSAVSWNS